MSSDLACVITCSSAWPGSAPACWNRITFSRNTISVGIERMLNAPASSCCSSEFTLANTTSGCASEAFSNTGAKPRQGPHQGAQKSTMTIGLPLTVCSKLSLVSSTVAIAASFRAESESVYWAARGVFKLACLTSAVSHPRPPVRCISVRWSPRWQAGSTRAAQAAAGWCAWKTLTAEGHARRGGRDPAAAGSLRPGMGRGRGLPERAA